MNKEFWKNAIDERARLDRDFTGQGEGGGKRRLREIKLVGYF